MMKTRTALGALAIGVLGAGTLAACAPEAPPTTTAPGGPVTSTKNIDLSCTLDIFQAGNLLFSTGATYDASLTLTADGAVTSGDDADYTATVVGITNGPLAGVGGSANVVLDVGGVSEDSPTVPLGATPANGALVIPDIDGSVGPITGSTAVAVTGVAFEAQGANAGDGAVGTCAIPAVDQPTVTIGTL